MLIFFVLNFWLKSKTITVQGKEYITKEILDKLERLLMNTDDMKDSNEGISTEEKTVKKKQKNKNQNPRKWLEIHVMQK